MDQESFISSLKLPSRKGTWTSANGNLVAPEDLRLKLIEDKSGLYILPVDKELNKVDYDPAMFSGAKANLLREFNRIKERKIFDISWGTETDGISLTENPHLLYMLAVAGDVVDYEGTPLSFSQDEAKLKLNIKPSEEQADLLVPSLIVEVDGEVYTTSQVIADSFVKIDNRIYPVASLGELASNLKVFLAPFSVDVVDSYLTLFLTYIENVIIDYEGRKVIHSSNIDEAEPTLIFEKIDEEEYLYMRFDATLTGFPPELVNRFRPFRTASVVDNEVIIRHVDYDKAQTNKALLDQMLERSAPGKKEAKEIYEDNGLYILPPNVAAPFLINGLPQIISRFRLIGAEKLRKYKVKYVNPKININLNSGIDFLEGTATIEIDDERFTLPDLLDQFNRQRYITLSDGDRAILDSKYIARLKRVFKSHKKDGDKIRISFFDLPEIEDIIEGGRSNHIFDHHREIYEGFSKLKDTPLPDKRLKAKLRPYQEDGVRWIKYLYDNGLGGCLADDMGLGKTVQTIGVLSMIYPESKVPSLIVMPRSLLFNWQNELDKFAPQLTYSVYFGSKRDLAESMKSQLILTSYAIMRNDIELFMKEQFNYIILDESQNIKNFSSQTARAALLLKGDHRLAISGTPIENNLSELYTLFRFLNPSMLGSAEDFNANYAMPIQKMADKDAAKSLRRKIFPYILRRLKGDVLTDLPERMEQTLFIEMEPEHLALYERRRKEYKEEVNNSIIRDGVKKSQFIVLQALSELRRIASVPESLTDGRIKSEKLEMLIYNVAEAVGNGHKVVVFFNFIAGMDIAGQRLKALGIDFESMSGATREREKVVSRFQKDPNCKVMLMTIKTGGVGLNLTAADTVFIFEPWWNKAAELQAINRLHRIGQKAKVMSYSLIMKDTIEEKILKLQEMKSQLFDDIISSDVSGKELTQEDIDFILG